MIFNVTLKCELDLTIFGQIQVSNSYIHIDPRKNKEKCNKTTEAKIKSRKYKKLTHDKN